MLREEYNRLMSLFALSAEGKKVNLEEVFRESVSFFEHLTRQLKVGSPEERAEAFSMMRELHAQMQIQTQRISETSGLSEEQLTAYADNPANFTSEQWKMMQESKVKMNQVGKELAQSVSASQEEPPAEPAPALKKGGKKTASKRVPLKKEKWMRS